MQTLYRESVFVHPKSPIIMKHFLVMLVVVVIGVVIGGYINKALGNV